MYLVPKAFGDGASILTYGSEKNLNEKRLFSLRSFSKETLSVHLNHQLLHSAIVTTSNVNRVFTGHNLPRAFGHLTRRYIPKLIRLLDNVSDEALRAQLISNVGAIDKYLGHYYFLMKSWLVSADVSAMASFL